MHTKQQLLKIFSADQLEAVNTLQLFAKFVVEDPYRACLENEMLIRATTRRAIAMDAIAVLNALEPGEDPAKAIIVELKSNLMGKLALGAETSVHSMFLRAAMMRMLLGTIDFLESKNA